MTKAAKKTDYMLVTATIDERDVLAKVKEVETELAGIQRGISDVPEKLTDDDDYRTACALLIATVKHRDWLKEQKAGFMEDINRLIARVESHFAQSSVDATHAEEFFRSVIGAYALELDTKAAAMRVAASKVKNEDKAQQMFDKANTLAPPKVGGISLTRKSKVEIVDEAKLPEWAWKRVPDEKAIAAKLESGIEVKGARMVPTISVRVTPKNAKEEG